MRLRTIKSTLRTLPASTTRTAGGSWRDGRTTAERGYGGRWQRERLAFLAKHPLCIYCAKRGLIELASVVDHIEPHRGDEKLFWNRSNWQALCAACHDTHKRREEMGLTPRPSIGLDGWPTEQPEQGPFTDLTNDYLRSRGKA